MLTRWALWQVDCDMVNSLLPADDMSTPNAKEGLQAVGVNSILPKEHNGQFVNLPIVKYFTEVDNVSKTTTEWLCTYSMGERGPVLLEHAPRSVAALPPLLIICQLSL